MARTITSVVTSVENLTPTSFRLTLAISFVTTAARVHWNTTYGNSSMWKWIEVKEALTLLKGGIPQLESAITSGNVAVIKFIVYEVSPGTDYNVDITVPDVNAPPTTVPTQSITTANNKYCDFANGNDTTGTGTYTNPWKTIEHAISSVVSGDEIVLKDGIYIPAGQRIITKNISIRSENILGATIRLDIAITPYKFIGADNITFKIKNCKLINNSTNHNYFISVGVASDNIRIEIIECFGYSVLGQYGGIIGDSDGGAGALNYIYKSSFNGFRTVFYTYGSYQTLYVKDCIFANNYYCFRNGYVYNSSNYEDHNCFYNNTYIYFGDGGENTGFTDVSLDSTDITSDPKFVSADNYTLDPTSPCINKGVLIANYVTTFLGTAPDMGCGERIGYIYVDSVNGSDTTGDGTYNNPFKSIRTAYQNMSVEGNSIICKKGTYSLEDGFTLTKSVKITSESGYYKDVIITPRNLVAGNNSNCWIYANTTGKTLQFYDVTIKLDSSVFVPVNTNDYYLVQSDGITLNIETVRCFVLYKNSTIDGHSPTAIGRVGGTLNVKSYKCTYRGWKDLSIAGGDAIKSGGGGTGAYDVQDNIFADCHNSVISDLSTEDYNCFYGNAHNPASLGAHSITSNPQFIVADEAEISNLSPCVDAGVVISSYVTTYGGAAPDIGVVEIDALNGTTNAATKVATNEVQLNGIITNLGGNTQAYAYFKYKIDETGETYVETSKTIVTATGIFSLYLTGLIAGTNYRYELHLQKIDTTGDVSCGEETFITLGEIDIDTNSATQIELTTATINGILNSSGLESGEDFNIKVWFEYKKSSDTLWISTVAELLSATGEFNSDLTGLTQGVVYQFRAKASADDGTREVTGSILTFKTGEEIAITTGDTDDVKSTSVTLNGTIDNLGGESSIKVWFEYGLTAELGLSTSVETKTATGDYSAVLSGLTASTLYYYRLVASKTDDTNVIYGDTEVFMTAPVLTVITLDAISILDTSAILKGNLTSLGENDSVKVYFKYKIDELGEVYTTTSKVILTEVGEFSIRLTGLTAEKTYRFLAYTSKTDDTGEIYGAEKTFYTEIETVPYDKYLQSLNTGEDIKDIKYDENDYCLRGVIGDGYLFQLNDNNFFDAEDKSIVVSLSKTNPTALCFDSNNIYVGTNSSPAELIKLNKSNIEVETYILPADHNEITSMVNDTDYVFIGCSDYTARVVQFNKSTGAFKSLSLEVGTTSVKDLIVVGQYIYAIDGSKIYKINKDELTLVTTYDSTVSGLSCIIYDEDNQLFYLATNTDPVKVIKFEESTATFTITTIYGSKEAKTIEIDYAYVYIGCNQAVLKIELDKL